MTTTEVARGLMREVITNSTDGYIPHYLTHPYWEGIIKEAVEYIEQENPGFYFTQKAVKDIAGNIEVNRYNKLRGYTILDFLLDQYYCNDYTIKADNTYSYVPK